MVVALFAGACGTSARRGTLPPPRTTTTAATKKEILGSSVDGVQLAPVSSSQRNQCQAIANQTRTPVPCPGLIPKPGPASTTATNCANAGDFLCPIPQIEASGAPPTLTYFVWNQYAFQVPAGYAGVPGEKAADGGPLGHLVIYSAKNLNVARDPQSAPQTVPAYCAPVHEPTPLRVHGSAAVMYECTESGNAASIELDQGHELLVWRQSGVTCEVSLHGHSHTNQDLALAIARATTMVSPAGR